MDLMTVKQTVENYAIFSEGALQWHLFHREQNGLNKAVVKIGRRIFLDRDRFEEWIESKREG